MYKLQGGNPHPCGEESAALKNKNATNVTTWQKTCQGNLQMQDYAITTLPHDVNPLVKPQIRPITANCTQN